MRKQLQRRRQRGTEADLNECVGGAHACKNYVLNNSFGNFALLNVSAFMKMQNFSSCKESVERDEGSVCERKRGREKEGEMERSCQPFPISALTNNEQKFRLCQVKRMLFNLLTFIAAKLGN